MSDGAAPWLLEAMLVLVSAPELEAAVRQQKNVGKFYHKRVLSKMQRFFWRLIFSRDADTLPLFTHSNNTTLMF